MHGFCAFTAECNEKLTKSIHNKEKTITSIDDQSFASVSYHVQEKTDKDFFITQKTIIYCDIRKKKKNAIETFSRKNCTRTMLLCFTFTHKHAIFS